MDVVKYSQPESFHGFDKWGRPVYILKLGAIRCEDLAAKITLEDYIRVHIWGQEYSYVRSNEQSEKMGKRVSTYVSILDLKDVGMSKLSFINFVNPISKLDEGFYPECMGATYMINPPTIFSMIWKIIKPWLDPITVEKIKVLKSNYQEVLLDNIDADQLPEEYGGTCKCGDHGCVPIYSKEEINEYECKAVEAVKSRLELKDVVIASRTDHSFELVVTDDMLRDVEKVGKHLDIEFYFESIDKSVLFSVEWVPDNLETSRKHWTKKDVKKGYVHLRTPQEWPAHKQPVYQEFTVYETGKLKFVWDNSGNYFWDRKIKYGVGIKPPADS